MMVFSSSRIVPRWMVWEATFVRSFPLNSPFTIGIVSVPETRIIPSAPCPGGVASAVIVLLM